MAKTAKNWDVNAFVGGALSLDFINTNNNWIDPEKYEDLIDSYADLVSWSRAAGVIAAGAAHQFEKLAKKNPRQAAAALRRARRLRETIYRIFAAISESSPPDQEDVQSLCASFADAGTRLAVLPGDDGIEMNWKLDPRDAPTILAPIIFSAIELLLCGNLKRLKQCKSCGWLFLDTSKSGRRRWCDMKTCGNRAKVTRFRRKTR